jgi:hypothetical protein
MPLIMRPTGLGCGVDKDRPDYGVYSGEWNIGRIYETRGGPDSLRWLWSMNASGPLTRSGHVANLEEAKAQFQKAWDAWEGVGEAGRGPVNSAPIRGGREESCRGAV